MANVKGGAAIIFSQIVWVGAEGGRAGGVAVGIVENVIAEERKFRSGAHVGIDNELPLPKNAVGLVFKNVADIAKGPNRGRIQRIARRKGAGDGRVDIADKQSVNAAAVKIGEGEIGGLGELALEGGARLHDVWRAEIGIEAVSRADVGIDLGIGCGARLRRKIEAA